MKDLQLTYSPYTLKLKKPFFTARTEIKERRGFISVDREFDNSKYQLEYVVAYSNDHLNNLVLENDVKEKSDFENAAEKAEK